MRAWVGAMAVLLPAVTSAGSFYLADHPDFVDRIAHTPGYTGTGGEYPVEVCLEPGSPAPAEIEPRLEQAVATWNALQPTIGNFKTGDASPAPSGTYDWESVLLHELGHCVYALAHANGTPTNPYARYAVSLPGPDQSENLAPGPDGISGTEDDTRGDDIPYTWFSLISNNPFEALAAPSPLSMGIFPWQLPLGHRFPSAPLRGTAEKLGLPPTESVMAANFFPRESKRALVADEVNTARLALAGLDEIPGTPDDYRVKLVYVGERADCGLSIRWRTAAGTAPVLGYCAQPAFTTIRGRHIGMGYDRSVTFFTNHAWSFATNDGAGATAAGGGTVLGVVWNDLDRDGVRDLPEPGVPHIAVSVSDASGKAVARGVTGSDGRYMLKLPRDGSYQLRVIRAADFATFSPRDVGSDTSDSDVATDGSSAVFALADGATADFHAGLLLNVLPGAPRDRLRCHRTASETFPAAPVAVSDGHGALTFTPARLATFCDSVDTEGVQPISGEGSAFACYAGRRKGSQPAWREVVVRTSFGEFPLRIGSLRRQCWPALQQDSVALPTNLRTVQCYGARGLAVAVTHSLTDRFDRRTVTRYSPALACFAQYPGEGYVCYKTKSARQQPRYRPSLAGYRTAVETDAGVVKPAEVCLPAVFG